jgi:hypothetical protein
MKRHRHSEHNTHLDLRFHPEEGSTALLKQGQSMVIDRFTPLEGKRGANKRAFYIRWVKKVFNMGRRHTADTDVPAPRADTDVPARMLHTAWSSPIFLERECVEFCSFPSIFVDYMLLPKNSRDDDDIPQVLNFASALLQYSIETRGPLCHISVRNPPSGSIPCRIDNHLARQTVQFQYLEGGLESSSSGPHTIDAMNWNVVLFDEDHSNWIVEIWLTGYEKHRRVRCHFDAGYYSTKYDRNKYTYHPPLPPLQWSYIP